MEASAESAKGAAAEINSNAARLGLQRGVLLVAGPLRQGSFIQSVVSLLDITANQVKGVVIHGGPGGPVDTTHSWTLFHSQVNLASCPWLDSDCVFVEDRMTQSA